MRAVNLLPRDAARTGSGGRRHVPLVVLVGGIAAVTALAAFLAFSAAGAADERRAELALTEAAIAAIPRTEPAVATGLVAQERADRVAALSAALSSRIAVDRVLRELSFVLPADAWLTGLVANAPSQVDSAAPTGGGPTTASPAAGVTIQGATFSHEAVARVLARLSVLPTLDNVRLTSSARIQRSSDEGEDKKKRGKQRAVVTFTISADLRSGGRS